mmetsp:Transcript_39575/g.55143  ORF Transcript_39575/g.55143 Transcript_39575/m.55143 type:complete len:323 (+) Transcript_39575:120-1088(+)
MSFVGRSLLRGVFSPIPVAFSAQPSRALDLPKLKDNLCHFWFGDREKPFFDGVCVLGSNGEFTHLSEEEKKEVLRTSLSASRSVIPNIPMIAGTGCPSTQLTIERSNMAADLGYDAVMVVTPYYYKSLITEDVLFDHFTEVADKSKVPVVLYSMPAFTGIEIDGPLIKRLAAHPNIIGLKDSTGSPTNLKNLTQCVEEGDDFSLLAGSGSCFAECLQNGATGGIMALSNIMGDKLREIFAWQEQGEFEKAKRFNDTLIAFNSAITRELSVPGLKHALDVCGAFGGSVRKPLPSLTQDQKEYIENRLKEAQRMWEIEEQSKSS